MLGRSQGTWGESAAGDTRHATLASRRRKPSMPPRTSMTAASRSVLRFDLWTGCLGALVLMFAPPACTTYHVADAGYDAAGDAGQPPADGPATIDGAPDRPSTTDSRVDATTPACVDGATRLCKDDPDLKALGNCGGGVELCGAGHWGACSVVPASKDSCALIGDDATCNGQPNEGCPCVDGNQQPCGPAGNIGICKRGTQTCAGGAWGACMGAIYAAARDCTSAADNDCDGLPDNTLDAVCVCAATTARPCGQHAGQDGKGRCTAGTQTCVVATDRKTSAWGTCTGSIGPAAADACTPGNDDNCNGNPNEGCTCVEGSTQGCGPAAAVGICKKGSQTCTGAVWGACVGAVLPAARDCTSTLDNDCDGHPDNTIDTVCACASGATQGCGKHPGQDGNGPCKAGSQTCVVAVDKKSSAWGACVGSVGPAAVDGCDPTNDDNCNGTPHEGCTCVNGTSRGCGPAAIGICKPGTQICANATWPTTCTGAVTAKARDCTSTVDNDCDGLPDNQDSTTCACPANTTNQQCPGNNNTGICKAGTRSCTLSADKTSTTWGACTGVVTASTRDCTSTLDNDCNGTADNLDSTCTVCTPGKPVPCTGNSTGSCTPGAKTCTLSADKTTTIVGSTCVGQVLPAAADTCDLGNDANCNSAKNEGCQCINGPIACPCGTATCTNGKPGACNSICTAGQVCNSANQCVCNAASCPNGCCKGNTCMAYASQSPNACGADGGACAVCAGSCNITNGRCLVTLASGQTFAAGLAVDSTSVYWTTFTTPGGVLKVPLGGGIPTTLASPVSAGYIAVDSANVYWTSQVGFGGSVMKVPLGGGATTTLDDNAGFNPFAIAVDSTSVYWVQEGNGPAVGSVMKVPRGGGTQVVLASAQAAPGSLAIDSTSVYWTNQGSIGTSNGDGAVLKIPLGGGALTTLASAQFQPSAIAVDSTSVYWINYGLGNGSADGTVMKVPLGGGTPTPIVSGQVSPRSLVVDSTSAYWLGNGVVLKVPLGGGTVTTLASGPAFQGAIAVDSTSVYYTDSSNGTLTKVTPK